MSTEHPKIRFKKRVITTPFVETPRAMVKRPVNMRMDEALLKEFDTLPGNRTENIEAAMRTYMQRGQDEETPALRRKVETLETEVRQKVELLHAKEAHVKDLEEVIGGLLHALPPATTPTPTAPPPKKRWWQRWIRGDHDPR